MKVDSGSVAEGACVEIILQRGSTLGSDRPNPGPNPLANRTNIKLLNCSLEVPCDSPGNLRDGECHFHTSKLKLLCA